MEAICEINGIDVSDLAKNIEYSINDYLDINYPGIYTFYCSKLYYNFDTGKFITEIANEKTKKVFYLSGDPDFCATYRGYLNNICDTEINSNYELLYDYN